MRKALLKLTNGNARLGQTMRNHKVFWETDELLQASIAPHRGINRVFFSDYYNMSDLYESACMYEEPHGFTTTLYYTMDSVHGPHGAGAFD